jgi:uncharacterized OB-fold protein
MPKTIPVATELTQPFWDAVNEKKLVLQSCASCGKLQYPIRPTCWQCQSDRLEWKEVEGKGHILETMVVHDTRVVRRKGDVPFNVAVVSLDEDPSINFLANLPGTTTNEAPQGAAVELIFEEQEPGKFIHDWQVIG